MMKTGLNRTLIQDILDKLDECDGRLSGLLTYSATDEIETSSPIKMTRQESNDEVVYLSRMRKKKCARS